MPSLHHSTEAAVRSDEQSLDNDDESSRPSKKPKTEGDNKFGHAYALLCLVRDQQRETRARQDADLVGGRDADPQQAAKMPKAIRDPGVRLSRWSSYQKAVKRLLSEAHRRLKHQFAAVLDPPATFASPRRPFISTPTFAPRLDPVPRIMPGAWRTAAPHSARRTIPIATPPRPSSHTLKSSDAFSRFPKRSTSSTYKIHHYCPLTTSSTPKP
ncbi:hypothetical protein FB451DRAFT_131230 [Mycena latifolia]|nr:hypothetical protein FB451DRAFT_131230 [Mycena latifolia]